MARWTQKISVTPWQVLVRLLSWLLSILMIAILGFVPLHGGSSCLAMGRVDFVDCSWVKSAIELMFSRR